VSNPLHRFRKDSETFYFQSRPYEASLNSGPVGRTKPVYNECSFPPLPVGQAALAGVIGFFRVVFMSKQLKIFVLTVSVAIVVFTIVGGLHVKAASNDGAYRQLGVFSEVLSRIRT
jgi:hypothetical protein